MQVIYSIYSIKKPNRLYFGSAVDFKNRKSVHISQLRSNKHGNRKLQRHFNKYGESDLVFDICEFVTERNDILKSEQFYLDFFKPYFNICKTAGSNLGRKFGKLKKSHRENISKSLKGKKRPHIAELKSKKLYKYDLYGNLITIYKNSVEANKIENKRVRKYSNINKTIGGYVWLTEDCQKPDFEKLRLSKEKKDK